MTFDHLDDPNAPTLDGSTYDAMLGEARTRRHKRHLVQATAGATALAIAIAAVAVIATRPANDNVGSVIATQAPTTTTLDPSIWVTTELRVDQSSIAQGQQVTGTVVFVNRTDRLVQLTDDNGCLDRWAIAVGAGSAQPEQAFTTECVVVTGNGVSTRLGPMYLELPVGRTVRTFSAPATYQSCAAFLKCGQQSTLPPLPAGPAKVWFLTRGSIAHLQAPDPVSITITPSISGRLVVPSVVGMTLDNAIGRLRAAGFDKVCSMIRPGERSGTVQEATPAGGSVVARGTTIQLFIAGSGAGFDNVCYVTATPLTKP